MSCVIAVAKGHFAWDVWTTSPRVGDAANSNGAPKAPRWWMRDWWMRSVAVHVEHVHIADTTVRLSQASIRPQLVLEHPALALLALCLQLAISRIACRF